MRFLKYFSRLCNSPTRCRRAGSVGKNLRNLSRIPRKTAKRIGPRIDLDGKCRRNGSYAALSAHQIVASPFSEIK